MKLQLITLALIVNVNAFAGGLQLFEGTVRGSCDVLDSELLAKATDEAWRHLNASTNVPMERHRLVQSQVRIWRNPHDNNECTQKGATVKMAFKDVLDKGPYTVTTTGKAIDDFEIAKQEAFEQATKACGTSVQQIGSWETSGVRWYYIWLVSALATFKCEEGDI